MRLTRLKAGALAAVAFLAAQAAGPARGSLLVSQNAAGDPANAASGQERSSVSADGRYVAFSSLADNLVAGDTNRKSDVFVRDTRNGTTVRVSVSTSGTEGDRDSGQSGPGTSAGDFYKVPLNGGDASIFGPSLGFETTPTYDSSTGRFFIGSNDGNVYGF